MGLFSSAPSLCHAASPAPTSGTVASCSAWVPNSVQAVTVDGFARFGAAEGCGAVLINVSVTFFALPQSTIVLDGWTMRAGGYVTIQGPPSAPWSIRDVAVVVTNSVIEATGGPAVSVVLGCGYGASSASIDDGVVLRNVSLKCSSSRLWSSSVALNGQTAAAAASASVLSVTLAWTLDDFSSNVTIDRFFVMATDSDMRSKVTVTSAATAVVASIAAARYGQNDGGRNPARLSVSNSALNVLRCNASAVVSHAGALLTEAAAVTAVAGVAFGKLSSVGLSVASTALTVVHSQVESIVTVGTTVNAYAGTSVAGVAVGSSDSPVTVANSTTLYLAWSNAITGTYACAYAGSSVAGVAVGISNSPVTIANGTTFYAAWSNATSTSTSSTTGTNAYAGSSVAGIAVGISNFRVTIANGATFYLAWSNATSASTSSSTYAGSSVAGVAVGFSNSPITIANSTTFVGWSNATSTSTSTSSSNTYAASSVTGFAVGYSNSPVAIANSTTLYLWWSNATSTSASTNAYAYAGSSVAGVAVGHSNFPVTIANSTTFYVWWSNATSASSSTSIDGRTRSSVAGVVPATNGPPNGLNVTSASNVSACATGFRSTAVSCMMRPLSSSSRAQLCCTAFNAVNGAFPNFQPLLPPQITVPTIDHRPPPPSNQADRPRHGNTTSITRPHFATTTTSVSTRSPSGSTITASSLSMFYSLRLTSDARGAEATARPHRPIPSPKSSGRSGSSRTPTLRAVIQPVRATLAPSPSPNPVRHTVRNLGLGLDPTAATAVVATGYGSTAVAAALSPTSGNKASAASRLVSGAECTVFGDRDLSSFPRPNDWSLMPGFIQSIASLGSDDASGVNAAAAKVLTTVVLMVIVCASNAAA